MTVEILPARTTYPGVSRLLGLDGLRGLAILAMVVDHLTLLSGGGPLRIIPGRLALPLFFVVGGALVRRITWRHGWVLVVGLALPLVVPWIDAPNVLALYALGAGVVVAARRSLGVVGLWLVVVAGLTCAANGYGFGTGAGSYPAPVLVAMMATGALIGRVDLARFGNWVPAWVRWVGRYPLSVYVGHLLVLEALVLVASRG